MTTESRRDGWVKNASADNALATATKTGEANKAHVIKSVAAGYDTAVATKKKVTVKDDTTALDVVKLTLDASFSYLVGVPGSTGKAVSVELEASGTAGNFGTVSIHGYSIDLGSLLDTLAKRSSALLIALYAGRTLPRPDGAISASDRKHLTSSYTI